MDPPEELASPRPHSPSLIPSPAPPFVPASRFSLSSTPTASASGTPASYTSSLALPGPIPRSPPLPLSSAPPLAEQSAAGTSDVCDWNATSYMPGSPVSPPRSSSAARGGGGAHTPRRVVFSLPRISIAPALRRLSPAPQTQLYPEQFSSPDRPRPSLVGYPHPLPLDENAGPTSVTVPRGARPATPPPSAWRGPVTVNITGNEHLPLAPSSRGRPHVTRGRSSSETDDLGPMRSSAPSQQAHAIHPDPHAGFSSSSPRVEPEVGTLRTKAPNTLTIPDLEIVPPPAPTARPMPRPPASKGALRSKLLPPLGRDKSRIRSCLNPPVSPSGKNNDCPVGEEGKTHLPGSRTPSRTSLPRRLSRSGISRIFRPPSNGWTSDKERSTDASAAPSCDREALHPSGGARRNSRRLSRLAIKLPGRRGGVSPPTRVASLQEPGPCCEEPNPHEHPHRVLSNSLALGSTNLHTDAPQAPLDHRLVPPASSQVVTSGTHALSHAPPVAASATASAAIGTGASWAEPAATATASGTTRSTPVEGWEALGRYCWTPTFHWRSRRASRPSRPSSEGADSTTSGRSGRMRSLFPSGSARWSTSVGQSFETTNAEPAPTGAAFPNPPPISRRISAIRPRIPSMTRRRKRTTTLPGPDTTALGFAESTGNAKSIATDAAGLSRSAPSEDPFLALSLAMSGGGTGIVAPPPPPRADSRPTSRPASPASCQRQIASSLVARRSSPAMSISASNLSGQVSERAQAPHALSARIITILNDCAEACTVEETERVMPRVRELLFRPPSPLSPDEQDILHGLLLRAADMRGTIVRTGAELQGQNTEDAAAESTPTLLPSVVPKKEEKWSFVSSEEDEAEERRLDRLVGDEEIKTYIEGYQMRKRAQGVSQAILDQHFEAPAPSAPSREFSIRQAEVMFGNVLSEYELWEMHETMRDQKLYYVGTAQKHWASPSLPENNFGYDDENGDYRVVLHDHLSYRYEAVQSLGRGSFGQVLKCKDHKTGKWVAIKLIRNKKRFHQQALLECDILSQLTEWDPEDNHGVIHVTESFAFRNHLCIVMELLSINLYELLKCTSFSGCSLRLLRRFTLQALTALDLLRQHNLAHCDLKPENILLVGPRQSRLKLIDFGSACFADQSIYTYIQSRFYRAPEIILGMAYGLEIDMWSLGCILAEMYTGYPLFSGESEEEQLACIMEIFGIPPLSVTAHAARGPLFFSHGRKPLHLTNSKGRLRVPGSKTLAQILPCTDKLFLHFVSRCLEWDPKHRLTPVEALMHPWIRRVYPRSKQLDRRLSDRATAIWEAKPIPETPQPTISSRAPVAFSTQLDRFADVIAPTIKLRGGPKVNSQGPLSRFKARRAST